MNKRSGEILVSLINNNLYLFLREISVEDLKRHCREMRLGLDQMDFLLNLHPLAQIKSEPDFFIALHELENSHLFPFQLDPDDLHSSSQGSYSDMLRGKRLALVGPSVSIVGQGLGDKIESYDYVVRMNFQWPIPEQIVVDVGRRMDILYHCCNGDYPISDLLTEEFTKTKFVCYERNIDARVLRRFCDQCNMPSLDVTEEYVGLSKKLACSVNTGTVVISHLLKFDISELFIAGVTFYKECYYEGYKGHGADVTNWEVGKVPDAINQHQFAPQLNYCREILRSDSRVSVDSKLKEILALSI